MKKNASSMRRSLWPKVAVVNRTNEARKRHENHGDCRDRHGLPLSVSTHAANHHEVRLVQLCFDFYMIEAKPENLIGDRAYDSDPLDEELRNNGIEMIAPHRSNRSKPPTQDRRRLSRYMRRWLVERLLAWIQWQRRILVRWEYHLPRLCPARLPRCPLQTILR